MFGLLNVYKPSGISSFDVIRQVRRGLGRKLKLGHAGTLDPLAEGVLVVCLGPATKLVELLHAQPKEYRCCVRLGATSTTDDAEGEILTAPAAAAPPVEAVEAAVGKFLGTIEQVPPAHSAVKVGGRRAYKLARAGQAPAIAPRKVTIHALEVLEYGYPDLHLQVRCGSGTYLRALARDIGQALGVGGYSAELVRTAVGPFRAEQAVPLEQIRAKGVADFVISPIEAIPAAARIHLDEAQVRDLAFGRPVEAPDLVARPGGCDLLGAVGPDGRLVGLVRLEGSPPQLRPVKVFSAGQSA